ncbi:MarR family transcriptional regulator [Sinorhizobium sp. RAC02]|uniref:MarR family winged helix-turn-helix transcriptional regulator n=1 Tax=Sinorhizobium sp. RAC02 TaxID=1842534 RepID=UPI000858207F|nr:MarR family transcriptional regulator [Sinorhizobium sp. RAC02]AOF90134.1 winged helix DNA-binding domain protein [Sinorhizobium sp. RAC02]
MANRKLSALYDGALEPTGINIAQFSLLRNVERRQPVSLTELGRHMELDRSTLGRNVRVLERMGLVEFGSGDDQREALVLLTGRGTEILQTAVPLWQACQDDVAARLGPEKLALITELNSLL